MRSDLDETEAEAERLGALLRGAVMVSLPFCFYGVMGFADDTSPTGADILSCRSGLPTVQHVHK
jgi:hypothetical protein